MLNRIENRPIKGIAFDWGGVICEDPVPGFLKQLASSFQCTVEELLPHFSASMDGFQRGLVSEKDFLAEIADKLKSPPITKPFWKQALKAVYKEQPAVIDLIRALKGKGYALGLLSNTEIPARDFNLECGYDFFDARVFSCDEGVAKPEKAIYQLMAKRLKVEYQELLFIDDKKENVEGAIAAGVCGILFEGVEGLTVQLESFGVLIS